MTDRSSEPSLPVARSAPHVPRVVEHEVPPPPAAAAPSDPFGPDHDELLTLSGLLRLLHRRWHWALPVFALVVTGFGLRHKRQTPVYESRTSLRFTMPDERLASLTTVEVATPGSRLATEMLVLRSTAVAAAVANELHYELQLTEPRGGARSSFVDVVAVSDSAVYGAYRLESQNGRGVLTGPRGTRVAVKVGDTAVSVDGLTLRLREQAFREAQVSLALGSRQDATAAIRGGLLPSQPNYDADVVVLAFRGTDPGLVQQVPDVAARHFIADQLARRQAGGQTTAAFIAEQLVTLERQLGEAEFRLRQWREANRVIVPEAEAGAVVASRTEYVKLLTERRTEAAGIESLLNTRGGMPGWRRVLASPLLATNQAANVILTQVVELESQRTQLLARRTGADTDVQLLDRMLADHEAQAVQFVTNYLQALQTQISSYEAVLTGVGDELARIPRRELELKTLERDVQVLSGLQLTLQQRLKETEISNAADQPLVEVLDGAEPPGAPLSPDRRKTGALALLFGVLAAGSVAVLRDKLDKTVHSREDVERATGAPMIGLIPSFGTRPPWRPFAPRIRTTEPGVAIAAQVPRTLISVTEPRHVSAEAYRMLQANLRYAPSGRARQVLVVASAMPSDGKSTTSANLAATLAVQGKRVLLIDADLRRGELHKALGVTRDVGLAELLSGQATVEQVLRSVPLDGTTHVDLIGSSRHRPPNPTELLGSDAWSTLLAWARERYDEVVVDTSPVNMFADAMVAAMQADGVVLLARANRSATEGLSIAAGQLRAVNIPLLGVVLNDFDITRDARYGRQYSYRRYYNHYYNHYAMVDGEERG